MRSLLARSSTWWKIASFFFVIFLIPAGLYYEHRETRYLVPAVAVGAVISVCIVMGYLTRAREHANEQAAGTRRENEAEQERLKTLREKFAICKPVPELRPEDVEFEVVQRGETPTRLDRRPYYPGYVPRGIARFDPNAEPSRAEFTEEDLAEELMRGNGFVLHGPPTMGKTRTLYEIVTKLREWIVIAPRTDAPMPDPEVFEALIAGKNVVLVCLLRRTISAYRAPNLPLDSFVNNPG